MRSAKTLLLLIFAAMLLSAALPASAVEGEYFSVSGTVTDANWNPIPGALITIYDLDFNRITTQNTNSQATSFSRREREVERLQPQGIVHRRERRGPQPSWLLHTGDDREGDIQLDAAKTHYDDYTLLGSQPRPTATPVPTPTAAPAATPQPSRQSDNTVVYVLLFAGGAVAGAAVATLACFIVMRTQKP